MAIVSYTDEDGVHFTDEFSKTYEKHLKAVAVKVAGRPAETSKPEPVKPVSKPDVKSDLKVS
ncbi:hypothetical protein [Rhodococcus sp. NPDC060176]|uniref:hypothetical protein n=1 Tax=Rhodococcus sp. NPDC060176 TaxID=3347062 RepID=UPI0036539612